VSHVSGSGWVQNVGLLLGAGIIVIIIMPGIILKNAELKCVYNPVDATSRIPVQVKLASKIPVLVRPKDTRKNAVPVASDPDLIQITFDYAGVYESCTFEVSTAAPFGIVWWHKYVKLAFTKPIMVAPKIGDSIQPNRQVAVNEGQSSRYVRDHSGITGSIRNYQIGDSRRDIHWKKSAQTGSLLVKEREKELSQDVVIEVRFETNKIKNEEIGQEAMGTVFNLLKKADCNVILSTFEHNKNITEPVSNLKDAGRRIAKAISWVTQKT
jgi:uncharacterized protein (DUF58 family)